MFCSFVQDVKLYSEMAINSESILFDGITEFKYYKDEDKTVINSRIEDVSTSSNKNYTISFAIKHIFSTVDVQLQSYIGQQTA